MGWYGKLTFGTLGMFFGGPLGAIVGAVLGHHLLDKGENYAQRRLPPREEPTLGRAEQAQATYFVSMFSILGKLAKVDGVVTRDEIAVVGDFINNLPMAAREKQFAREVFNEAKDSKYSIEDFSVQFYQIAKQQPALLLSFLDILFRVAAADGTFHPNEEAALKRIKDIFRVSDAQFNNVKASHFKDVDLYYKRLNCTPASSNEEIKSNYKKLVKDFHPDTIVSKGLPEEFTQFATERFREIQEAYEKIRQERNF